MGKIAIRAILGYQGKKKEPSARAMEKLSNDKVDSETVS